VPYTDGTRLQQALLNARAQDAIPDVVLFLEHKPVVTLGNRGRRDHLLLSDEELGRRGIELAHAGRGGDVTYHGPGQLVMYPIVRLGTHEADAHGYLYNLEEVAIRTAAAFGVSAFRREGKNGAWTERGKLAAIGFRLKRWVTCHGMSFNVRGDLGGFETIVPCGLVGERVASLETLLGDTAPDVPAVRDVMAAQFEAVCGRRLERHVPGNVPDVLRPLMASAAKRA
jgi:lipoate-protein ligase B